VEHSDESHRAKVRQHHPAVAVWIRRALVVAVSGVLAVSVAACESTEQESAKIASEEPQPALTHTTATKSTHAHEAGSGGKHREHKNKTGAKAGAGK
jgi:hypothetical protein